MNTYFKRGIVSAGFYAVVAACGGSTGGSTGQPQTLGDASSGGKGTTGDTGTHPTGSPRRCLIDSDCGVGEIAREILSRADCMCLFGCPHLPLSRETIARRQSQYDALCDPRTDGRGNPCPIDDCARPPNPVCSAGQCVFMVDAAR